MDAKLQNKINQWSVFEITLQGPATGNPYLSTSLTATFTLDNKEDIENKSTQRSVEGFYDGEGHYKIRFMPHLQGKWSYETKSNVAELDGVKGGFDCIEPEEGNHGPVHVVNQFHFQYEDGTAYYPFGTTCYAWIHQSEQLQEQTLETLAQNQFNKIRMCVFPKFYSNNNSEPEFYPYEGEAPDKWDFTQFHPEFFRHLERRITDLAKLGIEVDLILFHPYDKGHWGFDRMSAESDDRYLRYVIARLGSFHNVWWSMANEYDYLEKKTKEDWNRMIELVAKTDPYHHNLSIHNAKNFFDNWNPYLTHASIQLGTKCGTVRYGLGRLGLLRDAYHKPVIYDEVGYEGNLVQRWGQQTPEELTDKFWQAIISSTYMTHGETFTHPEDVIWWSKGGKLRGKCPARIAFLKKIVEESGLHGLDQLDLWWELDGVGKHGSYYLYYFSYETPDRWKFELPAFKTGVDIPYGAKFQVDVIDAWNMTITPIKELFEVTDKDRYHYTCNYNPYVELPGRPFMAIRIRIVENE